MISLEEREGLIFIQKDHKHNRHQEVGRINYDHDNYDDDNFNDRDDDYDVFSSSQMIYQSFLVFSTVDSD